MSNPTVTASTLIAALADAGIAAHVARMEHTWSIVVPGLPTTDPGTPSADLVTFEVEADGALSLSDESAYWGVVSGTEWLATVVTFSFASPMDGGAYVTDADEFVAGYVATVRAAITPDPMRWTRTQGTADMLMADAWANA